MREGGFDRLSHPTPDPIRSSRRLADMAMPELLSLIVATIVVIATLGFLGPES
jgi:hypothetical protein